MRMIVGYIATLVLFAGIDFIWLGAVAKDFYRSNLASLMADKLNMGAAIAFYLVYALGVMIFAVAPGLQAGSVRQALISGGLFGFFAYAVYDLTNLATLKGWPLKLTIVDLVWGTILTAVCASLAVIVTRAITN